MNGGKRWDGRMGIGFVLLTSGAAVNILTNVGGEAGPPEFCCNELASFQVARVASSRMVVTLFKDGMAENVIIGDIDTALVGQDVRINLPVGEAGTEGEREIFIHGLECLEDKGITGGSGFNMAR